LIFAGYFDEINILVQRGSLKRIKIIVNPVRFKKTDSAIHSLSFSGVVITASVRLL